MANRKQSTVRIPPQAQVLISGKPVGSEQAQDLMAFSIQHLSSFQNWCSLDGSIGHLDAILPAATYDQLVSELELLTKKFPFLDVALSIMSGPPGTFTVPLVTFHLKEGTLKRSASAHFGHPAPKRLKSKV